MQALDRGDTGLNHILHHTMPHKATHCHTMSQVQLYERLCTRQQQLQLDLCNPLLSLYTFLGMWCFYLTSPVLQDLSSGVLKCFQGLSIGLFVRSCFGVSGVLRNAELSSTFCNICHGIPMFSARTEKFQEEHVKVFQRELIAPPPPQNSAFTI